MEFKVRAATPLDALGAVETVRAVYDEYGFTWEENGYHADLYHLGDYYLARGHRFAVAEGASGVVATVALELFPAVPGDLGKLVVYEDKLRIAGCDCALNRLYVHPSARRHGIGLALSRWVLAEAAEAGRGAMEIWSDKRFEGAHELYRRLGALVVGERICDDPDMSPEWGLLLKLPSE